MGGAAADVSMSIPMDQREGVNMDSPLISVIRSYVTVSTLALLWLIYKRYKLEIEVRKAKELLESDSKPILLKSVRKLKKFGPVLQILGRNHTLNDTFPAGSEQKVHCVRGGCRDSVHP